MAKRNIFTLMAGLVTGAAAVFLSNEKNRQKACHTIGKVVDDIKQAKTDYEKDPEAFKTEVKAVAEKTARKVSKTAKAKAKKIMAAAKS
ncbi:MAG: hypothetical protein ABIJ33_02480 [Patescibacteria group bacterium]